VTSFVAKRGVGKPLPFGRLYVCNTDKEFPDSIERFCDVCDASLFLTKEETKKLKSQDQLICLSCGNGIALVCGGRKIIP
jgi:RNase P subunit RPR2